MGRRGIWKLSEAARGKQAVHSFRHGGNIILEPVLPHPEASMKVFYDLREQHPGSQDLAKAFKERVEKMSMIDLAHEIEQHPKELLLEEVKHKKILQATLKELLSWEDIFPNEKWMQTVLQRHINNTSLENLSAYKLMFPDSFNLYMAFHQEAAPYTIAEGSKNMSRLQDSGPLPFYLPQRPTTGLNINDLSTMADHGHLPTAMALKIKNMQSELKEEALLKGHPGNAYENRLKNERSIDEAPMSFQMVSILDPQIIMPGLRPPEPHKQHVKSVDRISHWKWICKGKAAVISWGGRTLKSLKREGGKTELVDVSSPSISN